MKKSKISFDKVCKVMYSQVYEHLSFSCRTFCSSTPGEACSKGARTPCKRPAVSSILILSTKFNKIILDNSQVGMYIRYMKTIKNIIETLTIPFVLILKFVTVVIMFVVAATITAFTFMAAFCCTALMLLLGRKPVKN